MVFDQARVLCCFKLDFISTAYGLDGEGIGRPGQLDLIDDIEPHLGQSPLLVTQRDLQLGSLARQFDLALPVI